MISPDLFGNLIDDLINECIAAQIGAICYKMNTCIIVYADDILLISSNDYHLQKLLDICATYGNMWKIKFNSQKSNIIEFGKQFFGTWYLLILAIGVNLSLIFLSHTWLIDMKNSQADNILILKITIEEKKECWIGKLQEIKIIIHFTLED